LKSDGQCQQVAPDQRDSWAVAESTRDAIRSLGSLEHLFWLSDQNHFVHFAVFCVDAVPQAPLRITAREIARLAARKRISGWASFDLH
jgi:hypothetical protein